jgi:hypothetical protein
VNASPASRTARRRGALNVDLAVAMGILVLALIPLAYTFRLEQSGLRASYHRAVAGEILDGELEILAAGEWRALPAGVQSYPTPLAAAARNLPKGRFTLTLETKRIRLEWKPDDLGKGGPVRREVALP